MELFNPAVVIRVTQGLPAQAVQGGGIEINAQAQ